MKKRSLTIGATEFKAKCLELMDDVHERKCNAIVITKRGKPHVKIVPVEQPATPLRGSMKGTVKILGDLTEPLQEKWDALED
jgi:prevent-host-death family protein